ncbi:MAG: hypothetical protein JOZ27_05915 [Caulobacteraceae bacterium]|nr:hypothetical protein [Caulobacteraceae bacterium]
MQTLAAVPLSLITATTALVASIMSPTVTLTVARRQFQANVIATNRQKWIDGFRDRVSELLSLMNAAQVIKRHSIASWRGGLGPVASNLGLAEKFERAYMALSEIRLMTNGADADHQRLNEALETALAHLQHDEMRDRELADSIEAVIALGRTIIRHEWGRVKKGV